MDTQNNQEYVSILKKMISSLNIEIWNENLNNQDFLEWLKKYKDDKGNNVYHLLFKISETKKEQLVIASEIASLLIDYKIPVLCYNDQGKTPSDLAKNKTYFANVLQNAEQEELNAKILAEINNMNDDYNPNPEL